MKIAVILTVLSLFRMFKILIYYLILMQVKVNCIKRIRYLLLFILGIFFSTFSSCMQRKVQKISYFIPKGYVGWVAIVFNVDSSSNTIFSKENEVSYIINGQPCFFTIRNGIPPEGLYDVSYYYYDKKDTIKLIDGGRYCQVSNSSTRKKIQGSKTYVYKSFYISDTVKEVTELYQEMELSQKICDE